jgi:hypothetical protein
VDECQRFYRNQCLHGFATDTSPGPGQVTACVKIIQTAGSCAAQNSPETALAACGDGALASETDPALVDVCRVVERPELTAECSFLSGTAASGGSGGSAGAAEGGTSTGGAGGTAGA